jgi:predicted RNA-binding protein associated with RNAse of E/G family
VSHEIISVNYLPWSVCSSMGTLWKLQKYTGVQNVVMISKNCRMMIFKRLKKHHDVSSFVV